MNNMELRDKYLKMTQDSERKFLARIETVRRSALRRILSDARSRGVKNVDRAAADARADELTAQWLKNDAILSEHSGAVATLSRLATMYGVAAIGDLLEASWRSH